MIAPKEVPADFPRHLAGAVSGVHPKLLVRQVRAEDQGLVYVNGLTEQELRERYDMCRDLVDQFFDYCRRKAKENPDWTMEFNIARAQTGLNQKIAGGVWHLTIFERDWIITKLRGRLLDAPAEGSA